MNKETVDLIKQLADKLGTTAEHLWGVLVKQAPISAGIYLAISLIVIFIIICIWYCFFNRFKIANKNNEYIDLEERAMLFFLSCIPTVIAVSFLSYTIENTLAGFFNPEYWALKEILGKVK